MRDVDKTALKIILMQYGPEAIINEMVEISNEGICSSHEDVINVENIAFPVRGNETPN